MLLAIDPAQIHDSLYAFLSILLEGAFFIFIGTVISGFIDAYLPPSLLDRMLPKNRVLAVAVGGLLGAVLPVCECAIVPVIRRLVAKGLPLSVAITYMLAAPIINPVTMVSTFAAFSERGDAGVLVASSRAILAYGITVLVGLVMIRVALRSVLRPQIQWAVDRGEAGGHDHDHDHHHGGAKLVHALQVAQRDFTDVAMYFVVGVALTAFLNNVIPRDWIEPLAGNDVTAIPTLMGAAFILSLCSTSDAFVAASLDEFSYAAKLAFLIFGPMMDLKLIFLYSSIFKPRFVLILACGLFILVGVVCHQWGVFDQAAVR
ncbi:MAG: hypothetical protein DVB23_000532 [Verrucomicrobia bacterium]|jgi:uncharacterized membrane protein YraQ (UPF0718 family)|nr:MAG: hypothetical protein DVB23_000532 [Verrucomicrobiota bacterium]